MILAILALAATAPVDDPDLRCLTAVAAVLGAASQNKTAEADSVAGLTGIFMYYLGRVDAKRPWFDYGKSLGAVMNAPDYEKRLPLDLQRCGAEAEARGKMLKDLGEELKGAVPLTQVRPG